MPVFFFEHTSQIAEFAGALQEFAAVHADDFTVDVAGPVTDQKGCEVGELFDSAETVERVAVEGEGFEAGVRHQARERAVRGDWARCDGVHADAAVAPFHGEAAGEGFDAGFRNGGGDDISGAYGRVGGRDAEDGAGMGELEPPASAGHGAVERAHENNVDDGFPGARGKVFGRGRSRS